MILLALLIGFAAGNAWTYFFWRDEINHLCHSREATEATFDPLLDIPFMSDEEFRRRMAELQRWVEGHRGELN